jgi:hypothetical protein
LPNGQRGTIGRKFLNSPGTEVGHKKEIVGLSGDPRRPLIGRYCFLRGGPGFQEMSAATEL